MYPQHVKLRIHQYNYLVSSSWHFTLFHEEDARSNNPQVSISYFEFSFNISLWSTPEFSKRSLGFTFHDWSALKTGWQYNVTAWKGQAYVSGNRITLMLTSDRKMKQTVKPVFVQRAMKWKQIPMEWMNEWIFSSETTIQTYFGGLETTKL